MEKNSSQEAIAIAISKHLALPLNDLLVVVQEFVDPDLSTSKLAGILSRHNSAAEQEQQLATVGKNDKQQKTVKVYDLGFVRINVERLPQTASQSNTQYLYIATDMATHWVYLEVFAHNDSQSATTFLQNLKESAPFNITRIATQESSNFSDGNQEKKPSGDHPFDKLCNKLDIHHLLNRQETTQWLAQIKVTELQKSIEKSRHYKADETIATALNRYQTIYNQQISQINLEHNTPLQAIEKWQAEEDTVMRTNKTFKFSTPQLFIIWMVWLSVCMFFATQALQK